MIELPEIRAGIPASPPIPVASLGAARTHRFVYSPPTAPSNQFAVQGVCSVRKTDRARTDRGGNCQRAAALIRARPVVELSHAGITATRRRQAKYAGARSPDHGREAGPQWDLEERLFPLSNKPEAISVRPREGPARRSRANDSMGSRHSATAREARLSRRPLGCVSPGRHASRRSVTHGLQDHERFRADGLPVRKQLRTDVPRGVYGR